MFQFITAVSEERAMLSSYKMAHLAILGEVIDQITMEDIRNYFGVKSPLQRFINALRNIVVRTEIIHLKKFVVVDCILYKF